MKEHLLQAAENGNAEAQFNLGIICENGTEDSRYIVESTRPEAVKWFLLAAEQGLPRAQVKLADTYADEPHIAGNDVRSCGWYLVAAENLFGMPLQRALSGYERVAARMTADQIETARRFAQSWKPKQPREFAPDGQLPAARAQ